MLSASRPPSSYGKIRRLSWMSTCSHLLAFFSSRLFADDNALSQGGNGMGECCCVLIACCDLQALTHCDAFIRGLPGVVREAVGDTAAAAKTISENGWRCALRPFADLSPYASPARLGNVC